ncbi:MAG: hypothetical protein A3G80_14890 [Betaproteobacteria bacterium RIFCSPLOWO2_12_FULL_62_13b]|nr:MAG: hypothetical protein A3G80_14890 [Betaproteobacteria bacterium RIFCSPLOWO2_12_FULL_62_13b]
MKNLAQIRQQLAAGQFDFSRHAFRRAVERNISEEEIRSAGAQAEIIEEYPEDKYSPSVLMLGFTSAGRALHIQVSEADSDATRIITLYEPDPSEWVEFRKRR